MATATKKPVDEYEVVLTLTKDEAETLRQVVNRIGGSIYGGPRAHTDQISAALYNAGVDVADHPVQPDNRAIYFEG